MERGAESCKYLNVLQGESEEEEQAWYDVVSKYEFDGWFWCGIVLMVVHTNLKRTSVASEAKIDKAMMLTVMLGKPFGSFVTAIQYGIRKISTRMLQSL